MSEPPSDSERLRSPYTPTYTSRSFTSPTFSTLSPRYESHSVTSRSDSERGEEDLRRVIVSPSASTYDDDDDTLTYTDGDSFDDRNEVERALLTVDDELAATEEALTEWGSLPARAERPLSTIDERTEGTLSRPPSFASPSRATTLYSNPNTSGRSMHGPSLLTPGGGHGRSATEPNTGGTIDRLHRSGKASSLIAMFEDISSPPPSGHGHTRTGSAPAGPRSPSPFLTSSYGRTVDPTTSYGSRSRPSSPTKSYSSTYSYSQSATMSTLLSPPTGGLTTSGSSLRRPSQSTRSPLTSVRNIVAAWKERSPAPASPSPTPATLAPAPGRSQEGFFSLRRRADRGAQRLRDQALEQVQSESAPAIAPVSSGNGNGTGTRRGSGNGNGDGRSIDRPITNDSSSNIPPPFDIAELSSYARGSAEPLRIGLLWYLNVHTAPPFRWQRCQALLYPNMLLLSWIAPGGGRGIVTLDLLNCTEVRSVPSPTHPSAHDDIGTVAARIQSAEQEGERAGGEDGDGELGLLELLCPFQLLYGDGVERLAAESARERVRWVSAIWEALDRSVTMPDDRSASGSETGTIRTIDSLRSSTYSGSNGGSASTTFMPPLDSIPDLSDIGSRSSITSFSRARLARSQDDATVSNSTYLYPGDKRVIGPSRSSSIRRTTSLTDLGAEFQSRGTEQSQNRLSRTSGSSDEDKFFSARSESDRSQTSSFYSTEDRSGVRIRDSTLSPTRTGFTATGVDTTLSSDLYTRSRSVTPTQSTSYLDSTVSPLTRSSAFRSSPAGRGRRRSRGYARRTSGSATQLSAEESDKENESTGDGSRSTYDSDKSYTASDERSEGSYSSSDRARSYDDYSSNGYSRTDSLDRSLYTYSYSSGSRSYTGSQTPSGTGSGYTSEPLSERTPQPSSSDEYVTASQRTSYFTARSPAPSILSFESLPSIPSLDEFATVEECPSEPSTTEYGTAPLCPTPSVSEYTTAELCSESGDSDFHSAECRCKRTPSVSEKTPSTIGDIPSPPRSVISLPRAELIPLPPSVTDVGSPPRSIPETFVEEEEEEEKAPSVSTEPSLLDTLAETPEDISVTEESLPTPRESLLDIPSSMSGSSISDITPSSSELLSPSSPSSESTPSVTETQFPEEPEEEDRSPTPTLPIPPSEPPPPSSPSSSQTSSPPRSPFRRPRSLWGAETDYSWDTSVLRPSPTASTIPLGDGPDISWDTSILRPTEDRTSQLERLTPIPSESESSEPTESTWESSVSSELQLEPVYLSRSPSNVSSVSSISSSILRPRPESLYDVPGIVLEQPTGASPSTVPSLLSTPTPSDTGISPRNIALPVSPAPSPGTASVPYSVSLSSPHTDRPSIHSTLETVLSAGSSETILTHDVNRLLQFLYEMDAQRGGENRDMRRHLLNIENELRRLVGSLRDAPPPVPDKGRLSPLPPASPSGPRQMRRSPRQVPIPLTPPPIRARSPTSVATSISWLESPHSDDYSLMEDEPYPFLPPSPSWSSSSSSSSFPSSASSAEEPPSLGTTPPVSSSPAPSSSSSATVRPNTIRDLLEALRDRTAALWDGQLSTNHMLDELRANRPPTGDADSRARLQRLEDMLARLLDTRPAPPRPESPSLVIPPPPAPPTEPEDDVPSDTTSQAERFWRQSVGLGLHHPRPAHAVPTDWDALMHETLDAPRTGAPPDVQMPPALHTITYQPRPYRYQPSPEPEPPRPSTVPPHVGRTRPQRTQRPAPSGRFRDQPPVQQGTAPPPPTPMPLPPAVSATPAPTQPVGDDDLDMLDAIRRVREQRERDRRGQTPRADPIFTPGPPRGGTAPPQSWYTGGQQGRQPEAGPSGIQTLGDPAGVVPPIGAVRDAVPQPREGVAPELLDMLDMLRDNHTAQMAGLEQQAEITQYMRDLNTWFERDMEQRRAENRNIRTNMNALFQEVQRLRGVPPTGIPILNVPPPTIFPPPGDRRPPTGGPVRPVIPSPQSGLTDETSSSFDGPQLGPGPVPVYPPGAFGPGFDPRFGPGFGPGFPHGPDYGSGVPVFPPGFRGQFPPNFQGGFPPGGFPPGGFPPGGFPPGGFPPGGFQSGFGGQFPGQPYFGSDDGGFAPPPPHVLAGRDGPVQIIPPPAPPGGGNYVVVPDSHRDESPGGSDGTESTFQPSGPGSRRGSPPITHYPSEHPSQPPPMTPAPPQGGNTFVINPPPPGPPGGAVLIPTEPRPSSRHSSRHGSPEHRRRSDEDRRHHSPSRQTSHSRTHTPLIIEGQPPPPGGQVFVQPPLPGHPPGPFPTEFGPSHGYGPTEIPHYGPGQGPVGHAGTAPPIDIRLHTDRPPSAGSGRSRSGSPSGGRRSRDRDDRDDHDGRERRHSSPRPIPPRPSGTGRGGMPDAGDRDQPTGDEDQAAPGETRAPSPSRRPRFGGGDRGGGGGDPGGGDDPSQGWQPDTSSRPPSAGGAPRNDLGGWIPTRTPEPSIHAGSVRSGQDPGDRGGVGDQDPRGMGGRDGPLGSRRHREPTIITVHPDADDRPLFYRITAPPRPEVPPAAGPSQESPYGQDLRTFPGHPPDDPYPIPSPPSPPLHPATPIPGVSRGSYAARDIDPEAIAAVEAERERRFAMLAQQSEDAIQAALAAEQAIRDAEANREHAFQEKEEERDRVFAENEGRRDDRREETMNELQNRLQGLPEFGGALPSEGGGMHPSPPVRPPPRTPSGGGSPPFQPGEVHDGATIIPEPEEGEGEYGESLVEGDIVPPEDASPPTRRSTRTTRFSPSIAPRTPPTAGADILAAVEEERRLRNQMDEERRQADEERRQWDAERARYAEEQQERIRALEAELAETKEELAGTKGELAAEREDRILKEQEIRDQESANRELEREAALERHEALRNQLGEVTDLLQQSAAELARKKEALDERWAKEDVSCAEKMDIMRNLMDLVQRIIAERAEDRETADAEREANEGKPSIEQVLEQIQAQYVAQMAAITDLLDAGRADSERQHEETLNAVRQTAQEQVPFNVQGYLDEFSKALASEVRMLLGEVGKLREEKRNLQYELGCLMVMKSKYGPGGEFDPEWKPSTDGPPDAGPPPPPPDEPVQARPAWRNVPAPRVVSRKSKKAQTPAPQPEPAPQMMDPRMDPRFDPRTTSWATWQPVAGHLTPPTTTLPTTLLHPENSTPGLFGPRSRSPSNRGGNF